MDNLSRINTHDKFTLEDAGITEMIGSKLRIFFKSRDARYRSLARVVRACFCYKFSTSTTFHFVYVSTYYRALKRILFTLLSQTFECNIFVAVVIVILDSDVYLRSLMLSHKMGGEKCAPLVRFGEKCAPLVFFSSHTSI